LIGPIKALGVPLRLVKDGAELEQALVTPI
jgi:hypothetical protein